MPGYGLSQAVALGLDAYRTGKDRQRQKMLDAIQAAQDAKKQEYLDYMRQKEDEQVAMEQQKLQDARRQPEIVGNPTQGISAIYPDRTNAVGQQIQGMVRQVQSGKPAPEKPAERMVDTPYGPISEKYAHNYIPELKNAGKDEKPRPKKTPADFLSQTMGDLTLKHEIMGKDAQGNNQFVNETVKPSLTQAYPHAESLSNMYNYGQWTSPDPNKPTGIDSTTTFSRDAVKAQLKAEMPDATDEEIEQAMADLGY
jgi:hypothetical protein